MQFLEEVLLVRLDVSIHQWRNFQASAEKKGTWSNVLLMGKEKPLEMPVMEDGACITVQIV